MNDPPFRYKVLETMGQILLVQLILSVIGLPRGPPYQ